MLESKLVREDETLDDLQLKGICVIQKRNGFRFGIDAVLLANFAKVRKKDYVVDLCSGTGIIPFIIAGKNEVDHVTGVEIQSDMAEMANRSVLYNDLQDKIDFVQGDLKDNELLKRIGKVDVVTVNPPYKLQNSGIINENNKNAIARHEICCTLDDVIKASSILLKDNGKLYMVHRPERIADILCAMRKYKVEPKQIRMVQPNINKAPNLILIEGQKNGGKFLKLQNTLYVYDEKGEYTKEINMIYGKMEESND